MLFRRRVLEAQSLRVLFDSDSLLLECVASTARPRGAYPSESRVEHLTEQPAPLLNSSNRESRPSSQEPITGTGCNFHFCLLSSAGQIYTSEVRHQHSWPAPAEGPGGLCTKCLLPGSPVRLIHLFAGHVLFQVLGTQQWADPESLHGGGAWSPAKDAN